jgi:ectoine hydroxylase
MNENDPLLTRITAADDQGPRKCLTSAQKSAFERDGFLALPSLIEPQWIERLTSAMNEFIERSRTLTQSNAVIDIDAGHTATEPRLRRLTSPADLHDTFWEFASQSLLVDVVQDLLGPDIKYHHSKLNFKSPNGGEEVRWHQDIQFWPHTNYSPLTVGVFLTDVEPNMGNVGFIPGSHHGKLFDQYDGDLWVGCLSEADQSRIDVANAVYPVGPAGSVTIHNCRTIHGSAPNRSSHQRPLLLQTYSAADAFAYTDLVKKSPRGDTLIRGVPARWARHDPRPCQVGPSKLRTIFEVQQRES